MNKNWGNITQSFKFLRCPSCYNPFQAVNDPSFKEDMERLRNQRAMVNMIVERKIWKDAFDLSETEKRDGPYY